MQRKPRAWVIVLFGYVAREATASGRALIPNRQCLALTWQGAWSIQAFTHTSQIAHRAHAIIPITQRCRQAKLGRVTQGLAYVIINSAGGGKTIGKIAKAL
ncbi:MAG: hypothetical protein RLZZ502_947, partial [Pseudomonadota bacterium]